MKLFRKLKENNNEEKPRIYSLRIEEIYSLDENTLVVGNLIGGEAKQKDQIYILGPYGQSETAYISEIKKVRHNNEHRIGLVIENLLARNLEKGYIVTNNNPHVTDVHTLIDNPYLHYLLEEVNLGHYDMMDQLFEEIAVRAHFLSIIEQDGKAAYPTITVDNQKWYPVFTNQNELELWKDRPGEKTFAFTLNHYVSMVSDHDDIAGIIINPFDQKRNMVLKKEIMEHLEKVKNNNIQQYLKQRKQFQKYYHKHRLMKG